MTQPTFAQLRGLQGGGTVSPETAGERLLTLLAVIASGQNPDGSAYSPSAPAATTPRSLSSSPTGLWNAASVGVAGKSTGVSAYLFAAFVIFGTVSAATTLTVEVSADFVTWRASSVTAVLTGAGDFVIDCRALVGSVYVRLSSSAAATITAGVMGNY